MVELLKNLTDLVPMIEKFINLGLSVIIALGAVAGLVYIVWYVMSKLNQTIQDNAEAINSLKDTLTANTNELTYTSKLAIETRDLLHAHHKTLSEHDTLANVMDERSKSVKEICNDTHDKVDEINKHMATASHIISLQKDIADVNRTVAEVGKTVAITCARVESL